MANQGQIGIRVVPNSQNFRRDLKKMLQRAERTIQLNLQVNLDGARKAIAKLRAELNDKPLKVAIAPNTGAKWREGLQQIRRDLRDLDTSVPVAADPDTAYARARLQVLTRPRIVTIFARLARSSMTTVATQIAALSGARLASDYLRRLRDSLENLDRSLPRISAVSLAITNLVSVALSASGGIIALGSDIASIGGAALALPGILGGAAVGVTTMALALADMGEQLEHLGPLFTRLQDQVSANFWSVAKAPIEDMVRNVLPGFRKEMAETSTNIGEFFASLSSAVQSHVSADALAPMFDNLRSSIDIASQALDPLVQAMMTLGQVGSQYLPQLAQWFVDISNSFNDWVQRNTESGQMFVWIDEGIAALQDLGSVLASTVRIFSGISKAAEAAGSGGLAGFAESMRNIADVVNGPQFQEGLTTIFEGAGTAMSALSSSVGDVGDALYNMRDTISMVLGTAGQTFATLISDIAAAVQHPVFQTGLVLFFQGIQQGLSAVGPALPALAAAFGQVGIIAGQLAATIGPVLGVAIQTLAPVVGQLLTAVQPLIPVLGDALMQVIQALAPVLQQIPPIISALVAAIMPLIPVVAQMVTALLPALTPILQAVSDVIVALSPVLSMVAMAFAQIVAAVAPFIMQLAEMLMPAITMVVQALAPLAAMLIAQLLPVFLQLIEAILPPLMEIVKAVIEQLPLLTELFMMVAKTVMQLVSAFAPLVVQLVEMLAPIFADLVESVLPMVVQALMAVIPPVLALVENIAGFLIPIIESLLPVVQTVFQTVSSVIQGAMSVIQGVINVVMGVIQGDWSQVWEGIKQIASGVWEIITSVISGAINAVLGIISSVLGVISSLWSAGWSAIGDFLSGAWDAIVSTVSQKIDNVAQFFQELPGKIGTFLANLPSQLANIGENMISSLANAISNAGGAVMDAIGGVVDGAVDWAKGLLGIASPSKVFTQIGEWTGQGFADGIKRQTRNVRSAADVMVQQTSDAFNRRNRLAEAANRDLARMQPSIDTANMVNAQDSRSSVATLERGRQRQPTQMIVQGPLVSVQSLTVDSDDRVKQISQDLYRRAADAARANGKIDLGGAVS